MSDDEADRFAELLRHLEAQADEHVRYMTDSMEPMLDRTADARYVPVPLDWHPAYAHRTDLIDWLNEIGPWAHLHDIRLPIAERVTWVKDDATYPPGPTMKVRVLTRQRCVGRAPYVGDPFIYTWNVSIDDEGRAIAGESRIQYIPRM